MWISWPKTKATKFRNTETYTPPYLGIIPTKKQIFFSAPHRPFDCKLHKEKSVCTLDWNDGQIFEMMQGVQKGPSGAKHGRLAYVLKGAKRVQKDTKWSISLSFDHFGLIWTLLNHFISFWFLAPKHFGQQFLFLRQNLILVQKGPKLYK